MNSLFEYDKVIGAVAAELLKDQIAETTGLVLLSFLRQVLETFADLWRKTRRRQHFRSKGEDWICLTFTALPGFGTMTVASE